MIKKHNKNINNTDEAILKVDLPKSNVVLVLGICSILLCSLFGLVGIILGSLARKLSKKSIELYDLAPELYTKYSYKNIKAGRICALIGIILSSFFLFMVLIVYAIKGTFILAFFN